MKSAQSRGALVGAPGWIDAHVYRVKRRFQLGHNDADDLRSQGVEFVLADYNIGSFDPARYPKRSGESEDKHRKRVEHKLRCHAGISLLRHLTKVTQKRQRATPLPLLDDCDPEAIDAPERPLQIGRARDQLRNILDRCALLDGSFAGIFANVIAAVLDGRSLQEAIETACPKVRMWKRALSWAQELFEDVRSESSQ